MSSLVYPGDIFAESRGVQPRRRLPKGSLSTAVELGWPEEDAAEAYARLALVRPKISSHVRNLLLLEHMQKLPPSKGLEALLDSLAEALAIPYLPTHVNARLRAGPSKGSGHSRGCQEIKPAMRYGFRDEGVL